MKTANAIAWFLIVAGVLQMTTGILFGSDLGTVGGLSLGALLSGSALVFIALGVKALVDGKRRRERSYAEHGAEGQIAATAAQLTFRDTIVVVVIVGALALGPLAAIPAPALLFGVATVIAIDYWTRHLIGMRQLDARDA